MKSKPIIELVDMRKRFGENEVLKGISFSVNRSEVVCIIGGSGSGKSTTLRCMNFLEQYNEGEVRVNGKLIGYGTDSQGNYLLASPKFVQRDLSDVCMVFQHFNLWPHLTVLKNVTKSLLLVKKMQKEKAEELARKMLDKVGMLEKQDYYPNQLSGGQQQRVAIARALATEPKIMLFDEPTSALDPELVGEVLKVITELSKEGMTMVIVTHEMSFAAQVSDKIIFLADGKVEEQGPPSELFSKPCSEKLKTFLRTWGSRNSSMPVLETTVEPLQVL
ncbi:MAG TPA: amino acid ABC transporter ATP-binding protein [Proteus sp.]|nr:amino acid ABC transporter ATP-binding protein [Proteus sp. (in: enterobacteria)]